MYLYGVTYLASLAIFLGIDSIWLTITATRLYRPLLGPLLRADFEPVSALLFYLLYVGGLVVFAIIPALAGARAWGATARGAFFGLVAYATYDLTNQATIDRWPIAITVADLCWGTAISAVTATLGYAVAVKLSGARVSASSNR